MWVNTLTCREIYIQANRPAIETGKTRQTDKKRKIFRATDEQRDIKTYIID